ncbi:MAG: ThiF family adenylyltransferase [Thermodesulfobacteriota bacterium]|nr:ThiF family adenylyltransferase [Thermodesulfobacteriota bacterium]
MKEKQTNLWSYDEAFCRNIGLISPEEQRKIKKARIAIAGVGGVGGHYLLTLARAGFERFNIADFDHFEVANFNRQVGATIETIGMHKAEAMKNMALAINPQADIKVFDHGISKDNITEFLKDADVVLDGVDFFNIETRRLLFKEAGDRGIYAITSGPMGFSATLHVFAPQGLGFDEYFDIDDNLSEIDKLIAFGLGLAPRATHLKYIKSSSIDLTKQTGPSLGLACQLCSAFVATEVMNIILKRRKIKAAPYYFQFDPYLQVYKQGYLFRGNKNPIQRLKRWYVKKYFWGRR